MNKWLNEMLNVDKRESGRGILSTSSWCISRYEWMNESLIVLVYLWIDELVWIAWMNEWIKKAINYQFKMSPKSLVHLYLSILGN